MHNTYFDKWILYFSSYLPLYFILGFKETDIFPEGETVNYYQWIVEQGRSNFLFYIVLVVLITISVFDLIRLLEKRNRKQIKLGNFQINPESDSLMNYVITYFPPLLTLEIDNTKSLLVNALIFLIIGCIYVGSSATFLNPVLGVLGYRIFAIEGAAHAHHIISSLTFDELERVKVENRTVHTKRIGEGVLLITQ
ncbi:hypothetical protein [Bifidobacterium oedipodis]|uniref:Uncharacterized protein n=1 Tax=Bifidobacterium oedipodis TaxID=2675322 RepID=A0A7Y0EMQ4_9BIFI|nr:hypothetical protein [Bifidobacterium sp. DSM 109957]NMM93119.1 hypothetical protein [Bifidobacterium sp. DSM 109957]